VQSLKLRDSCGIRPIAVIHAGEEIIHAFDFVKPRFINARGRQLFVQGGESEDVILDAFASVLRTCASPEDEGPVTGLGQQ